MGVITGIILLILAVLFYLLPALIAAGRHHHNWVAILALNILLGWTLLGWILALVWSVTAVKKTNEI